MYAIEIIKNQLPYTTQIEIAGAIYKLSFNYNLYDEKIYVSLYDADDNLLVEDEPVVMGQIMFARYYIDVAGNVRKGFPNAFIVPNFYDSSITEKMSFNNIDKWALFVEELK